MASNFQIYSFKTKNSIHLKLAGDFDGNSAYELINTLTKYSNGFYEIFIDTDDITIIHPFGREVFQKRFDALSNQFQDITFVGRNIPAFLLSDI